MVVTRDMLGPRVYISQEGCIGCILGKFEMLDSQPVAMPMDKDKPHARMSEGEACDKTLYQQLIEGLRWLAIGTRPDISFAVSYTGHFRADLLRNTGCMQ